MGEQACPSKEYREKRKQFLIQCNCINLPQNVSELAQTLPRYPKDISVIVVKMNGKENNFKHVTVRRQTVADAIQWLIQNNPHYKDVIVNQDSLNLLPEHGIPHELLSVDSEDIDENYLTSCDLRPQNEDDIVYEGTQMSSFLPIPEGHQQEIQALRAHLVQPPSHIMPWPTVENKPIN